MKHRYLVAILAATLATTACSKNANNVKAEDVLATVNGQSISKQEFASFVEAVSNGSVTADKLTEEQRTKLVDRLIGMHLAADAAAKTGVDKQGDTTHLLELSRTNILSDAMVKKHLEDNKITDADIQAEYDKQVGQMPKEYHASHILVKSKEEADQLIGKLKAGADFADLAKKNSTDTGSAKQGGDLGWFAPSSMVKEFGDAVSKLEKDQITDAPVQSQFGFHIIKLHESRAPNPPALNDVKQQVENIVRNKKIEDYLGSLRKDAKVEVKAVAPATSSSSSSEAAK